MGSGLHPCEVKSIPVVIKLSGLAHASNLTSGQNRHEDNMFRMMHSAGRVMTEEVFVVTALLRRGYSGSGQLECVVARPGRLQWDPSATLSWT